MSYRVAGLVGNTNGRDHIPWRIFNGGPRTRGYYSSGLLDRLTGGTMGGGLTDDNTGIFPKQFDLAQIMAICLRVKKWKLNGTVSYTFASPNSASTPTLTCTFTDYPVLWRRKVPYPWETTGAEPTKEYEMIDGPQRKAQELSAETFEEIIPPIYCPNCYDDGGGVVPNILFSETGILGAMPENATSLATGEASFSLTPQSYNPFFMQNSFAHADPTAAGIIQLSLSSAGSVTLGATGQTGIVNVACDLLRWEPPPIALNEFPQDQVLFDTASKKFSPSIYLRVRLAPWFTDTSAFKNFVDVSTMAQNAGIPPDSYITEDILPTYGTYFPDDEIGDFTILDAPAMPVFVNEHSAEEFLPSSGFAASLALTADKYWKYKNSLGADVYDEDTGAQLVDPFS